MTVAEMLERAAKHASRAEAILETFRSAGIAVQSIRLEEARAEAALADAYARMAQAKR